MSHYKIHFGGGMGDIYQDLMKSAAYRNLVDLKPEDICDVLLICHNPFALDFFRWHPKASQINAFCPGYWGPDVNEIRRKERGYFLDHEENGPPGRQEPADFYPSPEDLEILKQFDGKKLVVIQATAGCADRNIPADQMDRMLKDLKDKDCTVVGIGRNYERGDRSPEFDYKDYPWVVSMVDKLSVPGTYKLIQRAAGVIACHSCICLMAWHNRIPNILTLPRAINHINGIGRGENNQWTFGIFYPETQLVYSEDYTSDCIDRLLLDKTKQRNKPLTQKINGIEVSRLMSDLDVSEYRKLLEKIPDGSYIIEVGVFDGGSLVSLADTIKNKDLHVVAVDDFSQAMTDDFNARGQMLGSRESFASNMQKAGIMYLFADYAKNAASWFKEHGLKAHLVFVDADHSYEGVKNDVDALWPVLADGGIMAGHDFSNDHPGTKKYVQEKFSQFSNAPGSSVWSTIKPRLRFAVISSNDDNYKPLADITWTAKVKYCIKHGYDSIFYPIGERTEESKQTEGHNHWYGFFKIQSILDTLETGKYDWVFFSECDALITNMDKKLEDMVDKDFHVILSSNFDGINAGNMFVRNSEEGKNYLKYILSQRKNYATRGYAEQQVIMDMQKMSMFAGMARVVPQKLFNSHDHFLYEHYKVPKEKRLDMGGNPGEWEPGDFQVHWCGFGLEKRLEFIKFYQDKIIDTPLV